MIRLIPRETKFFRMFAEVSQNLTEGARLLHDILKNPANMEERLDRLQEIEHRGDDMTHAIITTLNQTFITPFDREDIHRLTSSLDDVLDYVNSAGMRLTLYRITVSRGAYSVKCAFSLPRPLPLPGKALATSATPSAPATR
jgi:predicted phosphate transport protein (TIGR00153 family)